MPRTVAPMIFIGLALVSATPSWAQTAAPPVNHSYDFVLGRWDCNGLDATGKVEYQFKQEVDKFGEWFRFQDPEGEFFAFMKFDAKTRLWRYFEFHADGTYDLGWSAPDFVNDRQTWTDSSTASSGDSIVGIKISDREKRGDFYQLKGGKVQLVSSEVCTKEQ